MPNTMEDKIRTPGRNHWRWLSAIVALGLCGSMTAFAQGAQTPPAPPPGAPPAPAAAPATPPGDDAAKARAAALAAKANIDITDAWTRAAPGTTADLFLHIVSAKDADRLLGVDTAAAERVEIRDEAAPGAAPKVIALPVDVPPGGTVNFAPGARHLSLVGLKSPLKEGDSFIVTFKFDKAGTQSAAVKILAANATGVPSATSARRGDTTAQVTTGSRPGATPNGK